MRTLLALSLALAALPAMAQTDTAPNPATAPNPTHRVKFYDFDPESFYSCQYPAGITLNGSHRARFGSLYALSQKSVIAKLKDTAKDVSLR